MIPQDFKSDLDELRKDFNSIRVLVPISIAVCLANIYFFKSFMRDVLFRDINKVPGALGAPFGGIIVFSLVAIFFIFGLSSILLGVMARGRALVLTLLGLPIALGSLLYIPLAMKVESTLDFNPPMVQKEHLIGTWMDDNYKLILSDDGRFELAHAPIKIKSRKSYEAKGKWISGGSRLQLINLRDEEICTFRIIAHDGNFFLSYNLPDDLDAWDGYLGLARNTNN